MATWQITISSKGLKKASVEKLVNSLRDKLGDEDLTVSVINAKPPGSRAERFSAAQGLVSDAQSELEGLRDELTDWYDNLPDNFRDGDKGAQLEEAISQLDDACSHLDDVIGMEVEFPGMY